MNNRERLGYELLGRQSPIAEARALLPFLDDGSTVAEIRELIAVPPATERTLRAYARAHPEEQPFIERGLKFRCAVLEELNRLAREGAQAADFPEVEETRLEPIPGPEVVFA